MLFELAFRPAKQAQLELRFVCSIFLRHGGAHIADPAGMNRYDSPQ
jgi:hypothetical protein